MNIRHARWTDWARVYAWRNNRDAVEASGGAFVTLDEHLLWFRRALEHDSSVRILIGSDPPRGAHVGMVRLDTHDGVGVVSIAVDAQHRERGYAGELLDAAQQHAKAFGLTRLTADVLSDNYASLRLFVSAGFTLDDANLTPADTNFTPARRLVTFTKELA